MNNKFDIVVYWSEQDGHYHAEVPEIPNIITDGATRVEALRNAEEIDAYLKAAHAASWTIPEPKGRLAFAGAPGTLTTSIRMKRNHGEIGRVAKAKPHYTKYKDAKIEGCSFAADGLVCTSETGAIYLFTDPPFRGK